MQAKNIIKELMQKKSITQLDVMAHLGLKSQSSISSMLSRDMKSSSIVKLTNFLGCDLIIRDKETGEEYLIDE